MLFFSADEIDLYMMINNNKADIVSKYIFVYVDDDVLLMKMTMIRIIMMMLMMML
jgi:hypothetical protein